VPVEASTRFTTRTVRLIPALARQPGEGTGHREGVLRGVGHDQGQGESPGHRPAEVLEPGGGVEDHHVLGERGGVPEHRGEEGVLRAETAGAVFPHPAHHQVRSSLF
jgi:hypothetical protein